MTMPRVPSPVCVLDNNFKMTGFPQMNVVSGPLQGLIPFYLCLDSNINYYLIITP
jgi:hypothetical protein